MANGEDRLRVGFIGLGMAGSGMVKNLAEHPDVSITAAADRFPEPREAFARDFEAEVYEDAEELCKSPNIDFVYIATPHQFHKEHVIMAAEYGKHIIVEKPMALTLEDCDAMIEAVDRTGVKLIIGHTHSYDPAIRTMREVIARGELGKLGMINTWNYTNFLYRPRRPEELDTSLGGGILFNQVPHQVDTVRLLGGGKVKSVRSATGIWDDSRPTEGSHLTFLEFEDGTAASLVYSGYDHFDSDELNGWVGEGGQIRPSDRHGNARRSLQEVKGQDEETALRMSAYSYRGLGERSGVTPEQHQPRFGVIVVSCENGDMRPTRDGIAVYTQEGVREMPINPGRGLPGRGDLMDELYNAVRHNAPLVHDGRWGKATVEVCLAILESSKTHKEITLSHQVATPS
jgi:phthalate 4,5-cis-dihydrodiol dehydrogenase